MATRDAKTAQGGSSYLARYLLRKDPHRVIEESKDPNKSLKKTLGAFDLTMFGVGAIIGAGIFVLVGVGATMAGPFLPFAFVLGGFVCALVGLSYSELASTVPTSGSAYAYTYSSIGELPAWTLGTALVLEYIVGASAVAIAWSGNMRALLGSFGVELPTWASFSVLSGVEGGFVNLLALILVFLVTCVLVVSTKATANWTSVFVFIKISILIFIGIFGTYFIFTDIGFENFSQPLPEAPADQWWGSLGAVGGVIGAAAIIFFAYIGFDAVSTTAEETKNPKRDLPIGILGSLFICTAVYLVSATVLVGMVPWQAFDANIVGAGVATARLEEPFGYAFEAQGVHWAATLIRVGAVVGLGSVIMVLLLGAPRVFFALARDGLLPQSWAKVHPRFGTPYLTTIGAATLVGLISGFARIDIVASLANIGTLFVFAMVCIGVIVLRYKNPELERPFKVPWNIGRFPVLPAIGAALCVGLMLSLGIATQVMFVGWIGLGLMVFSVYGIRNSVAHREATGAVTRTLTPTEGGTPAGAVPGAREDVEIVLEEHKE